MNADQSAIILQTVERAPQWMRRDLCSSDAVARARAEQTLAAMISEALNKPDQPSS